MKIIIILFTFITHLSLAAQTNPIIDPPEGVWQCRAFDGRHNMWTVNQKTQQSAINEALTACRSHSAIPSTCRAKPTYCELGEACDVTDEDLLCRVRDDQGHLYTWRGPQACLHALRECFAYHHLQDSDTPDVAHCYRVR